MQVVGCFYFCFPLVFTLFFQIFNVFITSSMIIISIVLPDPSFDKSTNTRNYDYPLFRFPDRCAQC